MATATGTKDAVLQSAVEVARAAAQEVAERADLVGEHLGVVVEGERLVSHRFATTAAGYRGWHWSVTVARVPRGRVATVCEVDLLPGDDAVLAPAWLPWSERLQPGDLGPGDVLPYQSDDERLDQGYEATGDSDADELAIYELGLGRARVISRYGRSEAAQRWYAGSHGPMAPTAVAASAPCSTCGFLLLMAGSLRTEFGVCGNEWSPDDGRVVSMDHGCGAHSETDLDPGPSDWPAPTPHSDEMDLELVRLLDEEPVAQDAEVADPLAIAADGSVEPLSPSEPVSPIEPLSPSEPVEPLSPIEPLSPSEPIEPLSPEPFEPTEPDEPTGPEPISPEPFGPNEPEPFSPSEPEPFIPAEPFQPFSGADPAEPTPADSDSEPVPGEE